MKKTMIRLAGMLCAVLIGTAFTSCEHDDDYETVADSTIIGTWDATPGFDAAMNAEIPAYEYLFQTMETGETEYKDANPDLFEGVDRPEQYDRVTFTAGLDGGHAIFYKKDANGNYVEKARYIARYSEQTIELFNIEKTVTVENKDEDGNVISTEEQVVPDLTLFKEYVVENLDGEWLKIVWNKSQRVVVTYTNQYESYNFKKVK
ncbi:MAG: hypothetical protein NC039_05580 [Muribaculaceae bacterium]|nr:hypothetical protein [Muribaculaceae bacterium]